LIGDFGDRPRASAEGEDLPYGPKPGLTDRRRGRCVPELPEPELQAAYAAAGRVRDFVQGDGLSGARPDEFLGTMNNPD